MSTFSTVYIDQNFNGVELKLPVILNTIKNGLNEIIKNSYDLHKIKEKEKVRLIPFIRNSSMVKDFLYTPNVYEDSSSRNIFRTSFNFFVDENFVEGYPQYKFKMLNDNQVVHHQLRTLTIVTDNNYDLSNHLDTVNENNNFISLSLGGDVIGQEIMKNLAIYINEELDCDTYYLRTDLENNLEKIVSKKIIKENKMLSKKNKNK